MAKILPMTDPFRDVLRYAPTVEETFDFIRTSDPAPRPNTIRPMIDIAELERRERERLAGEAAARSSRGTVIPDRYSPTGDLPGSGPAVTSPAAAAGLAPTATVSASFGPVELVLVAAMIVLAVKLL